MDTILIRITDYLLTQCWQIVLLVVVIASVNFLLKNKSAHIRYLLWLIVLAKCLMPTLYNIPLAVLPEGNLYEPVSTSPPAKMLPLQHEAGDATMVESSNVRSSPFERTRPPTIERRWRSISIREWLGIGWIVGAVAFLMFNLLRALRANLWLWTRRKALPLELGNKVADLFVGHCVKNLPKVWLVEGFRQPFVWGLWRGSIYLPVDFFTINKPENQQSVLGHEISHILRFDATVNIMQVIAQAIYWFHPFVWWANNKIRNEREKCCDEMAVACLSTSPKDYSTAVLETLTAQSEQSRPVPSLAVAGPVKNIEERIETMLKPGKKFYTRPSLIAVVIALLFALMTAPTALVLTTRAEIKTPIEYQSEPTKSLHEAVIDGDIEQVKKLISNGADINSRDNHGATPAYAATVSIGVDRQQMVDIVKLLVAKGAQIDTIHLAAFVGDVEKVKSFLQEGIDINEKDVHGRTPLHLASMSGQKEVVRLLIGKGADVNVESPESDYLMGLTPLHLASVYADYETAKLLIDGGADVNTKAILGLPPLWASALGVGFRMQERFMDPQADFDIRILLGQLLQTSWPRSSSVVKLLLSNGANVNENVMGLTLLHLAASTGLTEAAELFIARGADINAKDGQGKTPLHVAAADGQVEIVKLLLNRKADVNAKDKNGATALRYAMDKGNNEIVEILQKHGVQDVPSERELQKAAAETDLDKIKSILEKTVNERHQKVWGYSGVRNYEISFDTNEKHKGKASGHIRFIRDEPSKLGSLVQEFKADSFRGKRVRMSAWMKTRDAKSARLWMRVDGSRGILSFDNMYNRPVVGTTDWKEYEVILDVPQETTRVAFGAFVAGKGQAWVDDFGFEVVGTEVPSTNMEDACGEMPWLWRRYQSLLPDPPGKPVNLDFENMDDIVD
jgi:ankyrin repeat protein/beta-lactamase regulating signal transducer with metallopeptidase domain